MILECMVVRHLILGHQKEHFTGLLIRDCGLDSLEITGYVYQGTYIVLHKEKVNLNNA